ncbi:MAG: ABC-ATPase domain-containing protein [Fidelibacterota bacterium]|nr:MAG: ABC-ATPase domain-containing protein [Candidatus Neomarinimicrobiota bacterium]
MRPIQSLRQHLNGLDGKDYGAYQSLTGAYSYPTFELLIDQIPKDPYAPPHTGVYRVRVEWDQARFPGEMIASGIRAIAFRDYLTRRIHANCLEYSKRRGTGNSGIIAIAEPGQEILERTSVVFDAQYIEARMFLGLPASGRRIRADTAAKMIFEELPQVVNASLFADALDLETISRYLQTAEDAQFLRDRLPDLELAAFVADGAILPRISGVDRRPLDNENVVPFRSPESLEVSIKLPNAGTITGLGIPRGVTVLVGGGYHGKSTLLQALEQGVYNHIAGDGREFCVSLPETVKVRAYSGRNVVNTDISPFIRNIPQHQDTVAFSTPNASGSTSQAAFMSEAIEAGAKVLLMDEDTCATNFLIRDRRMQQLVKKEHEPITAFVDKVRQLYDEHGISTVLVLGGAGDYLEVADHIIQMIEFTPHDVTEIARQVVQENPSGRTHEGEERFELPKQRHPYWDGLDTRNEHGHRRVYAPNPHELIYGRMRVDLNDVEQLLESAQTKAIGLAIEYARKYMDGKTTLREVLDNVMSDLHEHGLDLLDPKFTGDLAAFRDLEFAAILNRMRDFRADQARV